MTEEGTKDLLRFGAVERFATDESYFSTPTVRAGRRRIGGLLLLFFTGTLTINVLASFEDGLNRVLALSFVIPLLVGTGGITGARIVSTMMRGIALDETRRGDLPTTRDRARFSDLLPGSL